MDRSKIKIVKRSEVSEARKNNRKRKIQRPDNAAREAVATVTDWVAELHQRKADETRAAFDMLFSGNRQPSES